MFYRFTDTAVEETAAENMGNGLYAGFITAEELSDYSMILLVM